MADTKTKLYAEKKVIEYGNQRIPVDDGVTLEQAKQQMARFFPELADPKVETKKAGTETTWVFSKKAGTKGVTDCQRVAAALTKLPAWVAVQPEIIAAITGQDVAEVDVEELVTDLNKQAALVAEARQTLLDVPAATGPAGDVL